MDDLPTDAKILKSLIAPARYSDSPTLFMICEADDGKGCSIYEQTPDGTCRRWPETLVGGVQQAESMVYRRAGQDS